MTAQTLDHAGTAAPGPTPIVRVLPAIRFVPSKTHPEQLRPEPFAIEVGYVRFSLCITQGALSLDVASSADGAHASMLTRLDAAAARLLAYQLMAAADHLEGLL